MVHLGKRYICSDHLILKGKYYENEAQHPLELPNNVL